MKEIARTEPRPGGPADLRDQRWLDERIEAIDTGIEAVLDIARNWTTLRSLSRLHPGVSAQTYILDRVKSPLGRGVVEPLLAESNWSNRQIAEIAGVSPQTVGRTVPNGTVDRPAETLGADGKLRPARVLRRVVAEVIEPTPSPVIAPVPPPVPSENWRVLLDVVAGLRTLAEIPADAVAHAVPERRRAGTAKALRQLGTYLGSIALELEDLS